MALLLSDLWDLCGVSYSPLLEDILWLHRPSVTLAFPLSRLLAIDARQGVKVDDTTRWADMGVPVARLSSFTVDEEEGGYHDHEMFPKVRKVVDRRSLRSDGAVEARSNHKAQAVSASTMPIRVYVDEGMQGVLYDVDVDMANNGSAPQSVDDGYAAALMHWRAAPTAQRRVVTCMRWPASGNLLADEEVLEDPKAFLSPWEPENAAAYVTTYLNDTPHRLLKLSVQPESAGTVLGEVPIDRSFFMTALLDGVSFTWKPQLHRTLHRTERRRIFCLLLVIHRLCPAMSRDMRFTLLSYIQVSEPQSVLLVQQEMAEDEQTRVALFDLQRNQVRAQWSTQEDLGELIDASIGRVRGSIFHHAGALRDGDGHLLEEVASTTAHFLPGFTLMLDCDEAEGEFTLNIRRERDGATHTLALPYAWDRAGAGTSAVLCQHRYIALAWPTTEGGTLCLIDTEEVAWKRSKARRGNE